MNRSVKDMTKSLETNKNVIYRIIDKLGLEPVQDDENNAVKVYSEESYQAVKKEFRKIQDKHGDVKQETVPGSDTSELVLTLRKQIERYETEIDRLNKNIEKKDETIRDLTDKLAKTVENSHLETIRNQELLAREQTTKLLLTAQSQTKFNLFKPSTWRRAKTVESPDLEPLTKADSEPDI